MLDGATEAIPIGERDSIQDTWIGFAEIEQHDAETTGMQEKVCGANGMFGIAAATDPENAIELDAGGMG